MYKLLFLSFICLNILSARAEGIILRGKVTDQKGKGIEAAYIEALKDSTQVLAYALSDAQGVFALELPENKACTIRISHLAHRPFCQRVVPPADESVSFVLEERNVDLDEVVVTGHTRAMKMNEEGHIVFTPEALGNTITYNLPRLLQTLPGVRISSAGITQNGRTTALRVNGHRRNLSGKSVETFLKSIPVDKIKEIVVNPASSAGDLASESGSIDIILKKEEELLAAEIGTELNMRRGGTYGNGNAFLMYNRNRFYMDLSLGYYNLYNKKRRTEESVYADSPAVSEFVYRTDLRENDYFGALNLEWETGYGHKLFASATGFYDQEDTHADNRMAFIRDASRKESTQGLATWNYDGDLYTVEMEFASNDTLRHQHVVGYGIIWGKAHNRGFNDETTRIEKENAGYAVAHNTINRHYGYQHQVKYNYKFRIDSNSSLKAGVRADIGKLTPESRFVEKEQATEDFLYADRYKMHDNVYAGFLEYAYNNKRTSVSAGLRVEYTDYSALALSDRKEYDYRRADYFPFFSASHKLGPAATLSLKLASGIERPHFLDYVPNFRYTSRYAYAMGNPELKPSKFYSATLNTMLFDFFYLGFTYLHTKDIISEITKTEENTFQKVTTPMNVCDQNWMILQANCPYVFLNEKLSGYLGIWFGRSKYTDLEVDLGHYYNKRYKGFYLTNQTQYEILKSLNIGYDLYYQPKLYLQQGISDPFFKLGFDVSYKIKQVSIGFNVSNVLNRNGKGVNLFDRIYTKYRVNSYEPIYSFTLKYSIGSTGKRKYREGIDSSRFK